jgi:hypothetical protein
MHASVIRSFTVVKYYRERRRRKKEKKGNKATKKLKILSCKQMEGIEQK